jgi:hypothetical protein
MTTLYVFTSLDDDNKIVFQQRSFYEDMCKTMSEMLGDDGVVAAFPLKSEAAIVNKNCFYRIDDYPVEPVMYEVRVLDHERVMLMMHVVAASDMGNYIKSFVKQHDMANVLLQKYVSIDVQHVKPDDQRIIEITRVEMLQVH